jgi:hypothetical protein
LSLKKVQAALDFGFLIGKKGIAGLWIKNLFIFCLFVFASLS